MSPKPRKPANNPANPNPEVREGTVERVQPSKKGQGNGSLVATKFQGPLPPPSLLQDYDNVVPGLAAQIVEWTTSQTAHRQQIEERAIGIDEKLSTWYIVEVILGQLLGFIIAILVLAAAVYLAMQGKEVAAGILGTVGFSSMVIAFITGRRKRTASEGEPAKQEKPDKQKK